MKKILSLILCLMLSCSLVGCGQEGDIEFKMINNRPFMRIELAEGDILFVDITEKTQYLMCYENAIAGMTLLVDSEGKPLLYEGEIPYGTE